MKTMFSRQLSLLLALILCVSMIPVAVAAQTTSSLVSVLPAEDAAVRASAFVEDFEGTFKEENTAAGTTTGFVDNVNKYVTGGASKLTASSYQSEFRQGSKMKIDADITVISDNTDHGHAVKFDVTQGYSNRGIDFGVGTITSDFAVVEYDFKLSGSNAGIAFWSNDGKFQTTMSYTGEVNSIQKTDTASSGYSYTTKFADYLPANELDSSGKLKQNTWYNAKYVIDRVHGTYDLFINDKLMTVDSSTRNIEFASYANADAQSPGSIIDFTKIRLGMNASTSFALYFDNVRAYPVSAQGAVNLQKKGFENVMAGKTFDINGKILLPQPSSRGADPVRNRYQRIMYNGALYTDSKYYNFGSFQSLSYTLTGANAGKFKVVDQGLTFTIKDPAQPLYVAVLGSDGKPTKYNVNTSQPTQGVAYLQYKGPDYHLDTPVTLNATFTKGDVTETASYTFTIADNVPSFPTVEEGSKVAIHMLGDSTVAMYPRSSYPRWGWGQGLSAILNEDAAVFNWARSGASSRTTYHTIWPGVKDSIKAGDFLLIQFAHNDQKTDAAHKDVWAPITDKTGTDGFEPRRSKSRRYPVSAMPTNTSPFILKTTCPSRT